MKPTQTTAILWAVRTCLVSYQDCLCAHLGGADDIGETYDMLVELERFMDTQCPGWRIERYKHGLVYLHTATYPDGTPKIGGDKNA